MSANRPYRPSTCTIPLATEVARLEYRLIAATNALRGLVALLDQDRASWWKTGLRDSLAVNYAREVLKDMP